MFIVPNNVRVRDSMDKIHNDYMYYKSGVQFSRLVTSFLTYHYKKSYLNCTEG